MRGVWCQALSPPRLPVLPGGQPGFHDPCVPAAVGAGMGTQHRFHRVRPYGPALLAVGVAEGRPRGGVPSTVVRGVCGQALPLTRLPTHWAGCWGPPPTCCGRGCVGVGAHHRPLGLHALWGLRAAGVGGGPSPGGLACHGCEGRLVSGAVPAPAARPLGRAVGVPRPVCPGCGRCGRGDPAPAPQREPLLAGVARCGGGGRASPGGGAFHRCEGRLWSGALPPPTARPLDGLLGSATTCCWRGCVGVGAQHCPRGLHALRGLRAAGVMGGRPQGGWPAAVVRGVWCQALSLPRPPVLWGGQPGFRDPCVPGAVGAGVGTQHRPHSVRPCGPPLHARGVAEGRPQVGCLPPL